ncbi:phosphodiester glycosidase family protein [Merismopedia glauca]|uniref:Phosphodiester glycosidase domain-containing protein n=1 Tax=Merismopedia glauca CCAP 1448/3 TaxID=1296344 RepID=A0A2T1BZM8_9CYAN|nr:phosphodiester glycosidase family protein [Merismopedia glauca]PSB01480.1 hypothetical protein C7B64_18115 [Merismopedia glauca CCAP 1448/3]
MSKTLPITVICLLWAANPVSANSITEGFELVFRQSGVELYQRISAINRSEYVTVVNLNQGRIANVIGTVSEVPDGKLERKSLLDFWYLAAKKNTKTSQVKALLNGTFFSQKLNLTPIAFGLKVAGNVMSYGYGLDEFPGLIKIFGFDSQKAFIAQYNNRNDFDIKTPDLIGALDSTANKSADKYLARNFVGIKDEDSNGTNETVIFYSSTAARQIDASQILDSFGAKEKVMLDGGSSTGLVVNGVTYIKANRTIPQAIAIYAGK